MPTNRVRVRDRADGKTSITIEVYEVVDKFAWLWDGTTAKSIRATLAAQPDADEIHVRINTDGGDVTEGIAMMTAWAEHPARVITHNDGAAYSLGSLFLFSGDMRRMSRGANIMAHLPWTIAAGNFVDFADLSDQLRSASRDLAGIYAQATGHSEEQWMEWLQATTWWTAQEALDAGLIDEITDTVAARAQLRGDEYPNIPARLLCSAKKPTKRERMPPEKRQDNRTPEVDTAAIAKAEQSRVLSIQRIGAKLSVSEDTIRAAIDGGTTLEEFRAAAVDEFEASKPPILPAHGRAEIVPGEDEADKHQRAMVGRLVDLAGMTTKVGAECKKRGMDFDPQPRHLMSMNLFDLARATVERAGVDTTGMGRMAIVGRAFTMGGGYDTTGHFPIAFEDALHKMLLTEYMLQDLTWRQFCATGRLNDFRPHNRYRLSELGHWVKVLESGEYVNVPLNDARREQIKADKYGNIIAVTREMIINDDMATIVQQARAFARAGAFTVERAVYDLLAENGGFGPTMSDGNPLYDASHNNIGAGSVISVAGLESDRVVMRRQKDDSGKRFLNLRPSRLVVATELWGTANVINDSQYDVDPVDTNATNNNQVPNKVRGLYDIIVDAPEITGTVRRSFADPGIQPVIEVGFLEGVQEPTIERQEGWRVDGTEWKGRLEFGTSAVDFNGTVYNAGA